MPKGYESNNSFNFKMKSCKQMTDDTLDRTATEVTASFTVASTSLHGFRPCS